MDFYTGTTGDGGSAEVFTLLTRAMDFAYACEWELVDCTLAELRNHLYTHDMAWDAGELAQHKEDWNG